MTRALVLVWLGTAAARTGGGYDADIEAWAEARQVRLEEPTLDTPLPTAEHDAAASEKIEALLAEAQTAAFGPDPGAASAALDAAVALLDAHPGLPEAPFLLAEAIRTRARLLGQSSAAEGARLQSAAAALDGPLAAPFGAAALEGAAPPPPGVARLVGLLANDQPYVDGRPGAAVPVDGARHHVRVLRDGRLALSRWVTPENGAVDVTLPPVVACSESDLARVRISKDRVDAESAVMCAEWVAMRPAGDHIEVARCQGAKCGTFLPWSRRWGKNLEGPAQPRWQRKRGDAFVPWLLGGLAAAAGTSILLWQTGAFEREGPTRRSLYFVPPERPARQQ